MSKYNEILELKDYCDEIGVIAKLVTCHDGFAIVFNCDGDVVQHEYSYGANSGKVEFAIGITNMDYTPIPLDVAKNNIKRLKNYLNAGAKV